MEAIHPNHFRTLGVPLLRGRAFSDADRSGALEVAIVSEDVACARGLAKTRSANA